MSRFLMAALAAFLLSACQTVEVAQELCPDPRHISFEEFKERVPPGQSIAAMLDEERSQAFIRAYNATPPPSHIEADRVWLHQYNGAPFTLVVFLQGDCATWVQQAPPSSQQYP